MLKIFTIAASSLILSGAGLVSTPAQAQSTVQKNCNNNLDGPRKSIQCTYMQSQPGMTWKGGASRARKMFVSKPAGDTGQEVVRLWINGAPSGEIIVNPGDQKQVFLKKGNSTIVARAEVETLKLPASGTSTVYVHFETLDRPEMPDLSSCSNTVSADRQSVCGTGTF